MLFSSSRSAVVSIFLLLTLHAGAQSAGPAGNEEVRKVMETFQGRGAMADGSKPTSTATAMEAMKLRDGLAIDLVAAEPAVAQPLYMSFDSRGRLWVTQYLQYQFPAGLKVTSYDQHLRAQFDKVPEPPPRGVKGADKITIFEDRDGDGSYETHRDVITGLNIASAAIKGGGGIWVMNPPYLLFYRDANDDDVPDGDPEVHLSGFGLEDTHSVASSLAFGPDGWLYGATGSTTTGNVSSAVTKNVRWSGQHIWRYHPKTKVFEIHAEGGGNTMSLEIDAAGRFFSGTNNSDRGIHYEQGMSGVKSFGKHGPAANPYSYGYFEHMATQSDRKRFSQTLVVYDGDLMAREFAGKFIAPNSLQNMIYVSARLPDSSTFKAIDETPLLTSRDRWFRPVDIKVGPDGAIWLADWCDSRLSHVSPVDDWSKGDGRIYRIRPAGVSMARAKFDLHTLPVGELITYLGHANKWFRRQAALELAWRGEKSALPELARLAKDPQNAHAFDALSALHMLGGLTDELATELLRHPDPYVRRWVVRCTGDRGEAGAALVAALRDVARTETHPEVRTQMLASAKRLPAREGLAVARAMMERDADATDKRIPLLLWWALEARAESDRAALLAIFEEKAAWNFALARSHGARLLARRWAEAGGADNYAACARLLSLAPAERDRAVVVEGIAAAFEGGTVPPLPAALAGPLEAYLKGQLDTNLALAVKTGNAAAVTKALAIAVDDKASTEMRALLLRTLAEAGAKETVTALLRILGRAGSVGVRKAALAVASRFDDERLAQTVISGYEARFGGDRGLRDAAQRMLASRREWALLLIAELDKHIIKPRDVADDVVRQMELHRDPAIVAGVRRHWPISASRLSAPEKVAEFKRLKALVATVGDAAKGKELFAQRCGACHVLFNEGGALGPDLTGYERSNPDFWLTAILDPSIEIREGYGAYAATLKNGQTLMGLLKRQDANGIELKDLAGQVHTAKSGEIENLSAMPVSLMPEGLLGGLSDAEIRDLFGYMMKR